MRSACCIMRIWLKSCRVELDAVIVLGGEMSSSHMSPCVASHDAGIGNPHSLSLYFSPSSLSLSISFYAHSFVALVNIFFALALVKRNESLYTRYAARERRARMVTYGHARSLTHSRRPIHMPYIKAHPVRHDRRNEEEADLASSFFKTNFRQHGTLQDFCLREDDTRGAWTVR